MADLAGRASPQRHDEQRVLGDFRLERLIGRGGMALVYEARQLSQDRPVALKLIAPEAAGDDAYRQRFMLEAQAVTRLEHPNVVPVYAAGEADGQLFIAMRLIEGEDLARIIRAEAPLPPERVVHIVRQIAAGLDAAHACGLVHRDVKPANVMVEHPGREDEHCYLTDFGLAIGEDMSTVTGTGTWAGTTAYVSPEQLRCDRLDARSDVYSLGVLAFHALAGRTPYAREHDSGTLLAHLHASPPSLTELRDLPVAVDGVIARALAKAPEARPASAGELAEALERSLTQGTGAGRGRAPVPGSPARPRPGNLPAEASSFVGRRAERQRAREALERSRLLSIVGPGGVGKTTLAVQVAASVQRDYAGVWMLELDSVQDAADLELALAGALGLRAASRASARDAVVGFVEQRRLLVLLDNCEHLVAATASLAGDLLAACPHLTILATSREPLAIDGEHVCALGPLEVPDEDDEPGDVLASDSARLLLERAREHGAGGAVGPESSRAVARICARLEGIPLALELAAARLRTLSVAELDRRLQGDLQLLADADVEGPSRRRTLDGMIDSSWRLLSADEQAVLTRVAVFAGSFTLEAAEAVAGGDGAQPDTGPLVLALADKSLLQVDAERAQARLRMLQPVREFCLTRLEASAQDRPVRARHRAHYLALAERARPMLDSAQAPEWLARLDDDLANIRAAIESGLREDDLEGALRIGLAMHAFWACRGLAGEGIELMAAMLREAGPATSPALRAKAHSALAHLAAGLLGDAPTAEPHAVQALRLARSLGDADVAAEALTWLSWSESFAGRPAAGAARAQEGLAGAASIEDPRVLGRLFDALGLARMRLAEADAAELAFERGLALFAKAGYPLGVALTENHRGDLDLGTGDLADAARHFSVARTTAEEAGDGASVAMAALNLALIDHLRGRRESARELFIDSLLTNRACGDEANIAFSIFGLALSEPDDVLAAELHGSASARLTRLGIALQKMEQGLREGDLARLRAALGDARLDRCLQRGRDLTVQDIIDAAVGVEALAS